MDSARNEIVQANTKSIGESPEHTNRAGPATRFDLNDLDTAGVGGAGKSRLRQAAVLAPDTEPRLTVGQPIRDRLREELLGPSIDSLLNSERGLEVGQIVLDNGQALAPNVRDRHGAGPGSLPTVPRREYVIWRRWAPAKSFGESHGTTSMWTPPSGFFFTSTPRFTTISSTASGAQVLRPGLIIVTDSLKKGPSSSASTSSSTCSASSSSLSPRSAPACPSFSCSFS